MSEHLWKRRAQAGLVVIAAGVVVVVVAVLGLWVYMAAHATPLHRNPQDVPSVIREAPSRPWTDAVAQARQIVRSGLSEQNLPGVSVAVGVGSDLVWAE